MYIRISKQSLKMYEVKLTEPKGEMGNLTIIVGDFNGPL